MTDNRADNTTVGLPWMAESRADIYPAIDPTTAVLSLNEKVVIVTGVAEGIGRLGIIPAIVKARPKGLVLTCRNPNALSDVVKEVEELDRSLDTLAVPTDISSAVSINHLMVEVQERFGHADILINNTDAELSIGPVVAVSPEMWWREFETSGTSAYLITQAFMSQLATSSHGTIVNLTVGSAYGLYHRGPGQQMAKQLSRQLRGYEAIGERSVTAVTIHPGVVPTSTDLESFEAREEGFLRLVGGTTIWLCSENARFLHGRWVAANWDVDRVYNEQAGILENELLRMEL